MLIHVSIVLHSLNKCKFYFAAHPHTTIILPAVRAISLQPILYKQKPNLKAAYTKLESFTDPKRDTKQLKTIANSFVPWLETFNDKFPKQPTTVELENWREASLALVNGLEFDKLFPLLDFWRLVFLEPRISAQISVNMETIGVFLEKAKTSLDSGAAGSTSRNSYVTLLRLLSNMFSNLDVATHLLGSNVRQKVDAIVVPCLLHSDSAVRSAAAGVAFNTAAYHSASRVNYYRDGKRGSPIPASTGSEEWELETIPALLESLNQENHSEEVGESFT